MKLAASVFLAVIFGTFLVIATSAVTFSYATSTPPVMSINRDGDGLILVSYGKTLGPITHMRVDVSKESNDFQETINYTTFGFYDNWDEFFSIHSKKLDQIKSEIQNQKH